MKNVLHHSRNVSFQKPLSRKCSHLKCRKSRTVALCVRATAAMERIDQDSEVFADASGRVIRPMVVDYGFRSGSGRLYMKSYGETPKGVVDLAKSNFQQEFLQMRQYTRLGLGTRSQVPSGAIQQVIHKMGTTINSVFKQLDEFLESVSVLPKLEQPEKRAEELTLEWEEIREKLTRLTLDNKTIVALEKARAARGEELYTPFWVKLPFLFLCLVLDVLYEGKPIQKFWVLETVARIPYFAYISILHLYESIGFWRAGAELRKIHFAEEWNEMHHLQIMESLGGDQSWFDRFVANHSAIAYFWLLIFFYLVSPKLAYNFMQRVELHARDTYTVFVESNKELLETIPPPKVALSYYLNQDLYLFDEFQQGSKVNPRRPTCNNLYEVFNNIRDDENEHVKTMDACEKETIALDIARLKSARK